MFDLGWSELMLIAVVATVVLGPKELPQAMRTAARFIRKLRLLTGDFQRHVDDLVREADLEDVRRQADKLRTTNIGQEIDKAIDPDGAVKRGLEIDPTGGPSATATPAPASPSLAAPAAPEAPQPPPPAAGDGAR